MKLFFYRKERVVNRTKEIMKPIITDDNKVDLDRLLEWLKEEIQKKEMLKFS